MCLFVRSPVCVCKRLFLAACGCPFGCVPARCGCACLRVRFVCVVGWVRLACVFVCVRVCFGWVGLVWFGFGLGLALLGLVCWFGLVRRPGVLFALFGWLSVW